ncbi:MAG: hypothetical protein IPG59_15795 [Candidatus Melainabacteria bacterium]|nr:MAG: hypothetical protein IPG59_15795 [Candidatus Melainabacteria bacterium]
MHVSAKSLDQYFKCGRNALNVAWTTIRKHLKHRQSEVVWNIL